MSENKKLLKVIVVLLLLVGFYTCFQAYAKAKSGEDGYKVMADFPMFYKAGKDAVSRDITQIYDVDFAAEVAALPDGNKSNKNFLPFLYPPQSLIFIASLGFFNYYIAFGIWFILPLVLLAAVLRSAYVKQIFAGVISLPIVWAVYFSFVLNAFLAGQNGMIWAALIICVLAMRKQKPIVAGILLSLFSIKPQLGVFIPLLLLFERNFKVLVIAALSFLIMSGVATAIWGVDIWSLYYQEAGIFLKIQKRAFEYIMVSSSPYMAFRMLPATYEYSAILQSLLSLAVVAIFFKMLRFCKSEENIILLVSFSALLFSSYSYIYDDIILALPCLIILKKLLACEHEDELSSYMRLAFILTSFIPVIAIKLHHDYIPYCFIAILFSFVVINFYIYKN
ncbi:MAG: glycosyltransferase family 87 protein, partial [Pseudomonadota bacterium]